MYLVFIEALCELILSFFTKFLYLLSLNIFYQSVCEIEVK